MLYIYWSLAMTVWSGNIHIIYYFVQDDILLTNLIIEHCYIPGEPIVLPSVWIPHFITPPIEEVIVERVHSRIWAKDVDSGAWKTLAIRIQYTYTMHALRLLWCLTSCPSQSQRCPCLKENWFGGPLLLFSPLNLLVALWFLLQPSVLTQYQQINISRFLDYPFTEIHCRQKHVLHWLTSLFIF